MGVRNSYVFGVSNSFSFLTFGGNSYVWGLDFLRLGVRNSYVWGLVFLRLGVRNLLRLGVSFLTFWGLEIPTFGG